MLLIISDTSVLIDIECGELTNSMFRLPFQFAIPDILFHEELAQKHGSLFKCGLKIKTMSSKLISEAYSLHGKYNKPGINDLLALVLAKDESCQLLTGDKALRQVANELGVEVHGTIWLVEQMIENGIVTVEVARDAYQRMRNLGSRLPWGEVDRQVGKLKAAEMER
jgi:predicted nucleic acid-binding protein